LASPRRIRPAQLVALGVALVLLLVAVAVAVTSNGGDDGAAAGDAEREVFLEPISSSGENPFAPPVGEDQPDVSPVATPGVSTQPGGQPGLYGGTMNRESCDKGQLVTYLRGNPGKATAWAGTFGIQVSEIAAYVDSLTSVVLRSDTRVTNHGFENGRATAFQAVLEAGTAVLVDDKGVPVVKCYCGNPLTPPIAYPRVYTGPRWGHFDPDSLTVVVQNTTIVDVVTIVDVATGETFTRPAGTSGAQDAPAGASTSSTTRPQNREQQPLTDVERRALAKFDRLAGECYPFPGIAQDVAEERTTGPGPESGSLTLRVVGTTAGGLTQVFTWSVDRGTLAFAPLDDLARLVSDDCPALGTAS
jgi:hypothetical protein